MLQLWFRNSEVRFYLNIPPPTTTPLFLSLYKSERENKSEPKTGGHIKLKVSILEKSLFDF